MPAKNTRKTARPRMAKNKKGSAKAAAATEKARVLSSEVVFTCKLFRVTHDEIIEPDGKRNGREVIRHNGSVVILALDNAKNKQDPWIVMERQYRHAAGRFMWELPAGKIDEGEEPRAAGIRELIEETGYRAKKWRPLVEYFPSPGFLGEAMKVFVAEGLEPGEAQPEEDENIELRLVKMSEVLRMIEKGAILDGKTLISVLLYDRLHRRRSSGSRSR